MASLFWVAGSTAYDGVTLRLATTSGGIATVALIAAGDTVTFDANSPAAAVVTTSAAISCTTLTLDTGFTGSLTMSNTLTVSGALTLTQGTLNTNGQTVSLSNFSSNNTNTRALTLGTSSVTCTAGGATIPWNLGNPAGLTFSGASSTITCNGAFSGSTTFTGIAQSYGTVIISGSGPAVIGVGLAPTFVNFTRTGTALKSDSVAFGFGITVTGTLTLGGNTTQGVNRLLVQSNVIGTQRTITATGAAVVISGDVDFKDVAISGSPSWTNSGSKFVGDCGGNGTLITTNRTTPATQTATGTTSFTWSTHGWTSRVPLPQDDVAIPNAFGVNRTITVDMPRLGASISRAGGSGSAIFSNSLANESYGSLTLVSGDTLLGGNTWTLAGRSAYTITSAGATFTQAIQITAPSGTYTLQDAFIGSRNNTVINITLGTFVDNGQSVTFSGATGGLFAISGGTLTKSGAWAFALTSANTFWTATGGTLTDSGSITLTAASANTRTFAGGGKTYGTLTYTVAGSTGELDITGSNTFNTINFSDVTNARTLAFTAGTTTTITGTFNVNGTSGKLMSVQSITAATHTLTKTSGNIVCDYLSVTNSIATGGANWYAGANSTDVSGNTGWMFTGVGLIAFDVASNSGYKTASSSYSWSHTTNGINRTLLVGISMLSVGGTSVTGITYNSVALTKIRSDTSVSTVIRTEIWSLTAPTVGSNTIAVTLSGAADSAGGAVSLVETAQSSPVDAQNGAFAVNVGAADATVDVTTVTNNTIVVDTVATDDTAITIGAGQTSRWNVTGTLGSGAGSTESKATAGTVTMSWTNVGAAQSWVIGAVAIKQVVASTGRALGLLGVG